MYKAFIEPDLQTAHIRIINKFNPFTGFQCPTYILKVSFHFFFLFLCVLVGVSLQVRTVNNCILLTLLVTKGCYGGSNQVCYA